MRVKKFGRNLYFTYNKNLYFSVIMQTSMRIQRIILNSLLVFVFTAIHAQDDYLLLQDTLLSSDDTSAQITADDAIIAPLDNLINLKYFENNRMVIDTAVLNIYGFKPDSVPEYDDKTYSERMAILDAQTPFDLVYNEKVKAFINVYAVKKRELTSRVIGLTHAYFPLIEEVLDRYDMPMEFKYLAIVESALNPSVKSRAGAVGLWQFMYHTGKLYHLQVTSYLDERRDPYKATEAACKYLKFLYNIYGDWELVMAAYNCGPGNVNRAIRRSGGKKNYWALWPYLPRETRGYVPAFIAVNYLMNHAAEHNLYPTEPKCAFFEYDTVHVNNEITFAQLGTALEVSIDVLEFLNPMYKKNFIPCTGKPQILYLPKEKIGLFLANESVICQIGKPTSTDSAGTREMTIEVKKTHLVRKGESIGNIANKYNCVVSDIKDWNGLRSARVYPGQKLNIYITETVAVKAVETNNQAAAEKNEYYTVQDGDTLWSIAKLNGISVEKLQELNKQNVPEGIKPGMKIVVKSGG